MPLFDLSFLKSDSHSVRLIKSVFWNLAGNSFSKILLMLATIFVAKLLGPEDFGKWSIVQSTTMIFSLLMGFGIGVPATKYLAEFRLSDKHKAGRFLSISLFFSVFIGLFSMLVLILSAEFIAINILKDASLVTIIKLSSFFLFFNSIFGVLVGALSGLERFKQIAFSTLLSGIFGAFIIVWATNLYLLEGVVWGYSIFYFVSDVLLLYFLVMEAKSMNIVFSLDFIKYKEECAQFFNFSMPAFISAAIGGPTTWGVYAIAANLPNGFFYIGIFNVAKILQNTLIQIGTQLNSPLLALIGNIEKSKHADRLNFAVPWLVITLLTFPFILVPEIFTFFFKNDNYNVPELDMVVAMVAFTTYVMLFKQSFARKIITEDLMWWGVIENIFWAISILIAVPLLIEKQNVLGLPNAFALVYFVDLLILIPFYYRKGLIPRELISWRAILCWLIVFGCLGMNFIDISMQLKLTIGLASILIELFLIYSLFFRRYII